MLFGSKFVYQSNSEEDEEISTGMSFSDDSDGDDDDGETCVLDILDSVGQEEYSSRRDMYTRTGDCFLLVYSITDRATFDLVKSLYELLRKTKHIPIVIVGNKSDLEDERQVTEDEGKALAASFQIPFIETSAKTGDNITEAFAQLVRVTPRRGTVYKVVVLGAGCVGKSSITVRYTRNYFAENYDPTIGESFMKHVMITGIPQEMRDEGKKKSMKYAMYETKYKKKIRKTDANVLLLKMSMLEDEPNVGTGDPVICKGCDAILSSESVLEKDGDHSTWTCELCEHKNEKIDMTPEAVSKGKSFDLVHIPATKNRNVLIPAMAKRTHLVEIDKEAAKVGTSSAKNEESKGMVLYCVDISCSMGEAISLPERKAFRRMPDEVDETNNYMYDALPKRRKAWDTNFHRDNTTSKLEALKYAVLRQLRNMKHKHPNKKVALVTFSSKVYLWGDCCHGGPVQYADNLNDYDWLIERGREYATTLELGGLEDTFSAMESKLQCIRTENSTALGPALAISAGIIASTPMSEVILCTDGESNVGVGDLSSQGVSFYSKIGKFAKENNTRLSLLAVEGQKTEFQHVQQCAVFSHGTINGLDPYEMMCFNSGQNYTVATSVCVTVILHPELVVDKEQYPVENNRFVERVRSSIVVKPRYELTNPTKKTTKESIPFQRMRRSCTAKEVESNRCVEMVGDARRNTELTFRYKFKNPRKKLTTESIPFQVQISYKSMNGMRSRRVLSKSLEVTHDRKQMEESINVAVVGVLALQKSARMASKGYAKLAQEHLKTTKRMMQRGAKTSTQHKELATFMQCLSQWN